MHLRRVNDSNHSTATMTWESAIVVNRLVIRNGQGESLVIHSTGRGHSTREERCVTGRGTWRLECSLRNTVFHGVEVEFNRATNSRGDGAWGECETAIANFDNLRVSG